MIYSPPAAHMPRTHACMRARKRTCNFALWCETMPRTRRPAPLAAARRALRYMMCESVNGDLIVAFQGKPLHTLIPSGKGCMRTAAASTQSAARARSGLCGGAQGRTAWVTRSWTCACRPHPTCLWTAPASRERCPPRLGPRSVLWVLSALLAPGFPPWRVFHPQQVWMIRLAWSRLPCRGQRRGCRPWKVSCRRQPRASCRR